MVSANLSPTVCLKIRLNLHTELSEEDIEVIDEAGARGALHFQLMDIGKRLAWAAALGATAFGFSLILPLLTTSR